LLRLFLELNVLSALKKAIILQIYRPLLVMKAPINQFKFAPLHIVLWVLVWLFFVYFFSYASSDTDFVFWFSIGLLPVTIAVTYVFAYLLIPRYLIVKKYVVFVAYGLATVISSVYAILLINFIVFVLLSNYKVDDMSLVTRNIFFVIILVYLVAGLVSFVQLLRYNDMAETKNKALENKVLETKLQLKENELYYLRQQIHPHFLFNTLNTIYGFALKESKDTPELILKLSAMLDYMLYQIDRKHVLVSEEIKYITSYIGLEQVRFRDTLKVTFTKEITSEVEVPPMLFMAFVENAFKHGAAVAGFIDVSIFLKCDTNTLRFVVKNTVQSDSKHTKSHGLGISTTRKRLDVLYPDLYTLDVKTSQDWYEVTLVIILKP
jgi:two-component system LytT family sensor kinase